MRQILLLYSMLSLIMCFKLNYSIESLDFINRFKNQSLKIDNTSYSLVSLKENDQTLSYDFGFIKPQKSYIKHHHIFSINVRLTILFFIFTLIIICSRIFACR